MAGRQVFITGIGSYSPGSPVPLEDMEKVLGELSEAPWLLRKRLPRLRKVFQEMLGIEYAHYAMDPTTRQPTETNVSMCEKSARLALQRAGVDPKDVQLLVYAGILFDYICPPSSVLVQEALQIPYCAEISIHSNCTAIYKAIQVAADLLAMGRYDRALIVTSQLSSVFLRSEYFNQKQLTVEQVVLRWFLSDGAGALVLEPVRKKPTDLLIKDTYLESVGLGIPPSMKMMAGAVHPNLPELYDHGWHHLVQDIKTVSELAPRLFKNGLEAMRARTGLNIRDVTCFFANVPTKHMMDELVTTLRKDFDYPDLPFYTKLSRRGYPGAPAIIIALDEYLQEVGVKAGDCLVSFVTESSKWMHAGFILNCLP